jgi:hypothetical protein
MTFKEFLNILYSNLHGSFSKGVFTSELLNYSVHEDCDELPKDDDAYRKYFNSGHLSKMTIDVIRKYRDPERFVNYISFLIRSDDVLIDLCDEFQKYDDSLIDAEPKKREDFCRSVSEQFYSYINTSNNTHNKNTGDKAHMGESFDNFNDGNDEYTIAISHAGQNSKFIESVVEKIHIAFPNAVFYDKRKYTELEGTADLRSYLRDVFLNKAKFIIVFMSKEYIENEVTQIEFEHIWGRYCNHPNKQNIVWITCDGIICEELKSNKALPINMKVRSDSEIVEIVCKRYRSSRHPLNVKSEHQNDDSDSLDIFTVDNGSKGITNVTYIYGNQYNDNSKHPDFGDHNNYGDINLTIN